MQSFLRAGAGCLIVFQYRGERPSYPAAHTVAQQDYSFTRLKCGLVQILHIPKNSSARYVSFHLNLIQHLLFFACCFSPSPLPVKLYPYAGTFFFLYNPPKNSHRLYYNLI
jgi:hypothetical protein